MANGFKELMAKRKAMAEGGTDDSTPGTAGQTASVAGPSPAVESAPAQAVKPKFNFAKPPVPKAEPVAKVEDSDDLSDLAKLSASTDEGTAPRPAKAISSGYADETPATAPTRDLPEELTKQQLQFVELIDNVYGVLDDPELLGNVIKGIMVELKANPQYMQMVTNTDVRTWVRVMRDSMGLARIKKTEVKAKRAGGGSKTSKSKTEILDMEGLGVDLDNL